MLIDEQNKINKLIETHKNINFESTQEIKEDIENVFYLN